MVNEMYLAVLYRPVTGDATGVLSRMLVARTAERWFAAGAR